MMHLSTKKYEMKSESLWQACNLHLELKKKTSRKWGLFFVCATLRPMNVFFLGPEGSYSEMVAKSFFPDETLLPQKNFVDVIHHIKTDHESVGVLPIENSITSNVHENIDALFENELFLRGERYLQIRLNLIGRPHMKVARLTHIASHPKALEQSQKFLKNLRKKNPNFEIIETSSTTEARNLVLDHPTTAAIGGEQAVEDSLLEILDEDIADEKKNYTRFVVVSGRNLKKPLKEKGKITAIFRLNHETGALAKLLTKISDAGGNLWKIESRPVPGMDWEYAFWADVEIDESLRKPMIDLLKNETRKCRILGVYPMGDILKS